MESANPPDDTAISSNKTRRIVRSSTSKIALIVLIGCLISVIVSFSSEPALQTISLLHDKKFLDSPSSASLENLYRARKFIKEERKRLKLASDQRRGHLSCERYGGPSDTVAQEMVYWQKIPSDNKYQSPFFRKNELIRTTNCGNEMYMTFEPDEGGFNNIRMAYETVLALAHAMGRTLVLVCAGFILNEVSRMLCLLARKIQPRNSHSANA